MRVTLTKPSGIEETRALYDGTVHFEGGIRGNNLNLNMHLRMDEAGPYWFNVYVDRRFTTRTPLEVVWTVNRSTGMGTAP